MLRLWDLRGLTWKRLLKRVWSEFLDDDVLGQAAKLSYYFLLALFPLLIFLTTLFGYFAQSEELRNSLLGYFRRVAPHSAFSLVEGTLNEITNGVGRGKLSISLIGTLIAASSGIVAIVDGLNAAYEVKETRPWWKVRLLAAGLTIGFSLFTLAGLLLILAGPKIGGFLAAYLGHKWAFDFLWNYGRWLVVFFLVLMGVNLLYRFAPDLRRWRLSWFTPGAMVAVLLWIGSSALLRLYLAHFNSYNATYGSLGAVIILLLWLYITGVAILVGAEVNSEIESAAARAGEADARLPGERAPGEKKRLRRLLALYRKRKPTGLGPSQERPPKHPQEH